MRDMIKKRYRPGTLARLGALTGAYLILTGCMGGGTSDTSLSASESKMANAAESKRANAAEMFAAFSPSDYSELSDIPSSGELSYSGFVNSVLSNAEDNITDSLIGDLSITVSFDAPHLISGVAEGFLDEDGNALAGVITLSQGTLDRDGDPNVDATLVFKANGELSAPDGSLLIVDADFAGDFLGVQYQAVGGEIFGQVTVEGARQALGGSFIADR